MRILAKDITINAGLRYANPAYGTVTSPTAGEGGVYIKPHGGRTKVGSTGDFEGRYGPNAKPGIEVEIP
ncbi:MAG: hypothetical protein KDA78_14950, partial [Planctomycetaceae bacterium]|nr:hypothetical protein [Planctomycetaceae bacterium]